MKFLLKLLLPFIRKTLLKELTKESNKTIVINKLNDSIDLPNLSEEDEKQVLENIYSAITKIVESYLIVEK